MSGEKLKGHHKMGLFAPDGAYVKMACYATFSVLACAQTDVFTIVKKLCCDAVTGCVKSEVLQQLTLETLLQHSMRRQLALYFSMVRRKLC